jgi:hypothetical protein
MSAHVGDGVGEVQRLGLGLGLCVYFMCACVLSVAFDVLSNNKTNRFLIMGGIWWRWPQKGKKKTSSCV